MKFLIVFAVALASAAATEEAYAAIIRSEFEDSPEGNFGYGYETGNGISAQAQGQVSGENSAVAISGSYKYTDPDGKTVEVSYVADKDGFRPKGDHLPVAPDTPPQIARALEYLASHPEEFETKARDQFASNKPRSS